MTYALPRLREEIAYIAYHFHWEREEILDLTHGEGGALTTVRFAPRPMRKPLTDWLRKALPETIAKPGMVGAAALENDLEVANAPAASRSMDHPKADQIEWLVLLEGADPTVTAAAARALFKPAVLKPFGVTKPAMIGTYRFLFGNAR